MELLETFRELAMSSVYESDSILQFYLDSARDIICDIRNTDEVEQKYITTQLKIAIELYSKRGAEGEVAHNELGLSRSYESADVSPSLLATITPVVKTPFSTVREVGEY